MKKTLSLLFLLVLTACRTTEREAVSQQAEPVALVKVETKEMAIPIITSGRLQPGETTVLAFKTGGIIDRVTVDFGDHARKGRLLAMLDQSEIAALQHKADKALNKAKRDWERAQALYAEKVATLEQLQNTETQLEVARADLKIARFNLRHSRILAPADGRILKRMANAGEMVAPGQPVLVFASAGQNWVVTAGVPGTDLPRIRQGDLAVCRFDAFPGRSFPATVTRIGQVVEADLGVYAVEVTPEIGDIPVAAGMVATVEITPGQTQTYRVIPVDAIVAGQGRTAFVFAVQDDRARRIPIEIAWISARVAVVAKGLEHTGRIVHTGAAYLTEGTPVRVTE